MPGAEAVHGKTPDDERKGLLEGLEGGRIDVLANCALLTEGWDCPPVSCIVMARPTQSRALYAQCIGRGLRPHDGKADCIILDITDNCRRHQLVTVGDLLGVEKRDCDGADVLEVGIDEEREAAEQQERRAKLATTTEEVDPFAPVTLDGYHATKAWHDDEPTEKQFGLLVKLGIDIEVSTKGEAHHLIEAGMNRRSPDRATDKQRTFLRRHRINASTMSRSRAGAIIGRIKTRSKRRAS